MAVKIITGDCRDVLRTLPSESIHTVVTSPPYWRLRDYGCAGQIGLEGNYAEFIEQMVAVFREVRRVLRSDGTLWLNLGDSYAGGGRGGGSEDCKQRTNVGSLIKAPKWSEAGELKAKDLCGIPWRVAFALQADGWWLRQDIIWSKPNPMPESVTDRCTKAHEYLFLLSKSERYYFDQDAIREPFADASLARLSQDIEAQAGSDRVPGKTNGPMKAVGNASWKGSTFDGPRDLAVRPDTGRNRSSYRPGSASNMNGGEHVPKSDAGLPVNPADRNKRSVWEVTRQPFSEAHFATFPPALIEPCIKAGCPEFTCFKCGTALDNSIKEAIRSSTNGSDLRPMRGAISEAAVPSRADALLQSEMCERGEAPSATVGPLPMVRKPCDSRSAEASAQLLQQGVRVSVDGEESKHDEGALHHISGVRGDLQAGSPERQQGWLRDGASACDGDKVGAAASADRDRASQERGEGGKRRGKSGSPIEGHSRQAAKSQNRQNSLPALRGVDSSVPTCPSCKTDLTRIGAIIPGTVLDCFGGAGTTGLVADRLQRNAILIELNPEYAAMAERRINGDAPLFAAVAAE